MSECVVRMEMPKNCDECPMCGTASGGNGMYKLWCMCGDIPASAQRIPGDCPILCSLPEGHGRLVDIDRKFLRVANDGHGMSWNWRGSIADMIDKDNMRGVEIIVPAGRSET